MIEIDRLTFKSCCGSASVAMKLSQPLSKDFLPLLVEGGFTAAQNYSKAGILYIENKGLIAQGAFGSNILQIKCRILKDKCEVYLQELEQLLTTIGEIDGQKGENSK